jgi:hypothetical protein
MNRLAGLAGLLLLVGPADAAAQGASSGSSFARASAYPTAHEASAVAVGNLNGDGRPPVGSNVDLVVSHGRRSS